ncbi:MAG: winged helix-turn-helix transcriptional regulator [Candidatus Helarchaeota archaeon]|nr:winged helix-turn-helix transcriptional regulator [Candidatus Helarchaeota archaeon]
MSYRTKFDVKIKDIYSDERFPPLEEIFSSKYRIKILNVLADEDDLSIAEISSRCDIAYIACATHLKYLSSHNILKERLDGEIEIYQFRKEYENVRALKHFMKLWNFYIKEAHFEERKRKTEAWKTRHIYINGRPAHSIEEAKNTLRNYLKKHKELPPHPEIPENAKNILANVKEDKERYRVYFTLLSDQSLHFLDIHTKNKHIEAKWIVAPRIIESLHDKWTVKEALEALETEMKSSHYRVVNELYINIIETLDEKEKVELLRKYWKLIIDIKNEILQPYLWSDIPKIVRNSLHQMPAIVRAKAFDTKSKDSQYNTKSKQLLEEMIDLFSKKNEKDEWHFLIGTLLFDRYYYFPEFSGRGLAELFNMYYCHETLNASAIVMFNRIINTSRWADTVAKRILEDRSPMEIGEWISEDLRALMAANLVKGYVQEDEIYYFLKTLKTSIYDLIKSKASFGKILSVLMEVHDSLREKVEQIMMKFLTSSDSKSLGGKGFVDSIIRLNKDEKEQILKFLSEDGLGLYLLQLLKCSNPNSETFFDVENIDAKQNLAKIARNELEQAINIVNESWSKDDIIMAGFKNTDEKTLVWATIDCLKMIQQILEDGWTFPEETNLILRCKNALELIKQGNGSALF